MVPNLAQSGCFAIANCINDILEIGKKVPQHYNATEQRT